MKKFSVIKISTIVLFVLCVVMFFEILYPAAFVYQPRLMLLSQYVSHYINENGVFPSSFDTLQKFIKEKEYIGETLMLDIFRIKYNFDCDNVKIINGCLRDENHKEVFLIDGPYNHRWKIGSLRNSYRTISLQWYSLLLSKKGKPSERIEENLRRTDP